MKRILTLLLVLTLIISIFSVAYAATASKIVTQKNTATTTYSANGTKQGTTYSWDNHNDHSTVTVGSDTYSKTGYTQGASVKKVNPDGSYTISTTFTGYYEKNTTSSSGNSSSGGNSGGSSYYPTPAPTPTPVGYFSIQSITPITYAMYSPCTAQVTVKNTGNASMTKTVTFTAPGLTLSKTVSLGTGASTTLSFTFLSPKSGSFTLSASSSNSQSVTCGVTGTAYTPPTDSGTGTVITWTEEDIHDATYPTTDDSGTVTRSYSTKNYTTYKATLTNTATVSPSTLKSGYGFAVNVTSNVTVTQIAYGGEDPAWRGTANKIVPLPPQSGVVTTGWTVTNELGTQPASVALQIASGTANSTKFEPKPSTISNIKSKLIFTNVALAGTKSAPKSHSFTVRLGNITRVRLLLPLSRSCCRLWYLWRGCRRLHRLRRFCRLCYFSTVLQPIRTH